MKIRTDFVTNSSSSSYIIATTKDLPKDHKNIFKELVISDIDTFLTGDEFLYDYFYNKHLYEDVSEKELKDLGNFTDDQLKIIKLFVSGKLYIYRDIVNFMKNNKDKKVYKIYEDRDWLYISGLLDFINKQDILDYDTDL